MPEPEASPLAAPTQQFQELERLLARPFSARHQRAYKTSREQGLRMVDI